MPIRSRRSCGGFTNEGCAFTLVELLVVLGIIALLIAMLMPALQKARVQARAIACRSQLHTIGQAMMVYANANRGWMFPSEQGLDVPINQRWFLYVLKPAPPVNQNSTDPNDWTPAVLRCPGDAPDPENSHSYLLNHHLYETYHIKYSDKPPAGLTPDQVIVMGEKLTTAPNYYVEILSTGSTYSAQVEERRHGLALKSNYLYLDMHVGNDGANGSIQGQDPWDFPS
jgi:type II secretory pathway pseudopilin PulG